MTRDSLTEMGGTLREGWGEVLTELTLETSGVCAATGSGAHTQVPSSGGSLSTGRSPVPPPSRPKLARNGMGGRKWVPAFSPLPLCSLAKKNIHLSELWHSKAWKFIFN